jgi:hypothetical protein
MKINLDNVLWALTIALVGAVAVTYVLESKIEPRGNAPEIGKDSTQLELSDATTARLRAALGLEGVPERSSAPATGGQRLAVMDLDIIDKGLMLDVETPMKWVM